MSGTYPASPLPREILIRSLTPTLVSVTHALNRQARSRAAHRWGFQLEYYPLTQTDAKPLIAFLIAQRGQFGAFTFNLPTNFNLGAGAGTPVINGAGQGGQSVITNGWTPATDVKAGDFVRFNGTTKVYMVTADVTADGVGNATLAINSPLLAAPGDGTAVVLHTAAAPMAFNCVLSTDLFEYGVSLNRFHNLEAIELQESV